MRLLLSALVTLAIPSLARTQDEEAKRLFRRHELFFAGIERGLRPGAVFVLPAAPPTQPKKEGDEKYKPPPPPPPPAGVRALTCRVFDVKGDILVLEPEVPLERLLTVRVVGESTIHQIGEREEFGEIKQITKSIKPADLKEGQGISVVVYSDGKTTTLLYAAAADLSLGGEGARRLIAKLGGKLEMRQWPRDKTLYEVSLKGSKIRDEDLATLADWKQITELDLSFTAITDAGVAHLAALPDLHELDLTGTKITDAAADQLVKFPSLDRLFIARTGMSNKGVSHILNRNERLRRRLVINRVAAGKSAEFRARETFHGNRLESTQFFVGNIIYGEAFPKLAKDVYSPDGKDRGRLATTYYHRQGPVGHVMRKFDWFADDDDGLRQPSDARLPASLAGMLTSGYAPAALTTLWSEPPIGVIRLNGGTHAAYGRPCQFIDFYNSTPEIVSFSVPDKGQPPLFGFIQDAKERGSVVRIFAGDERPTLAKQGPKGFYRALFVDVTRNDLSDVNTTLLTKQGVAQLLEAVTNDGVLCFHISHRHYKLELPLTDAAESLGLACKLGQDSGGERREIHSHFSSFWFMIARTPAALDHLRTQGTLKWTVPPSSGAFLWTDDGKHDLKAIQRK
jgi:Leucine Rich repeat